MTRPSIAAIRAILRRPALLILDEATSSLDNVNERFIQQAINDLHGKFTMLITAHRLSTVRIADRIAVISQGRLIETGSWAQLAGNQQRAFRRLLDAANLRPAPIELG